MNNMSLIKCPECDKEISDKVKACPHCGYPLQEEVDKAQKVEISSVNITMKKENKKKILISVIAICCVIVCIFGVVKVYKNEKAKQEAIKYEEEVDRYIDNIDKLRVKMISTGAEAEDLLIRTSKVWYNAIFEKSDAETDKYTKVNGSFVSDFNDALNNLYSDSETKDKISLIESGESDVSNIIQELQNPPEGYEEVYDTIMDLSTAFRAVTDLAINPKGSLQTFNQSKQEKIDKFMDLYNTLEAKVPN